MKLTKKSISLKPNSIYLFDEMALKILKLYEIQLFYFLLLIYYYVYEYIINIISSSLAGRLKRLSGRIRAPGPWFVHHCSRMSIKYLPDINRSHQANLFCSLREEILQIVTWWLRSLNGGLARCCWTYWEVMSYCGTMMTAGAVSNRTFLQTVYVCSYLSPWLWFSGCTLMSFPACSCWADKQ